MRRGMKDPGVKRKYSPHKTTVIPYTPRKCLCQFSAVSAAPAGITGLLYRVLTRPTHPTNRRQGGGSPGSHLMAVISAMPQKRPACVHTSFLFWPSTVQFPTLRCAAGPSMGPASTRGLGFRSFQIYYKIESRIGYACA